MNINNLFINKNPVKIDLYLEDQEYDNLTINNQNINTNKLESDQLNDINNNIINISKINNIVNRYLKSSDNNYWFEFNNKKNIIVDNIYTPTRYNEKSNFNINFVINYLYKISNSTINIPMDNILLQLINLTNKSLEEYINDWNEDKIIFTNSIPQIYLYGILYTKDKIPISNYIITKKYQNYKSLLTLNYKQAIKYIIKLLTFLTKLDENKIIYRNLKFSSIGYDFLDSEIEFVLLDYTDITLIKLNHLPANTNTHTNTQTNTNTFFINYKNDCNSNYAGKLIPYYVIKDFFNLETNWLNRLDRLYSVGLAECIIFILYFQDKIMEDFFSILYAPSKEISCIHYYKYLNIFDDGEKRLKFLKLINNMTPKYIEMDKLTINPLFIRIIKNCFETNYNNIKSPAIYLYSMNEIFKEYFNKKNIQDRQLIQPINDDIITKRIDLDLDIKLHNDNIHPINNYKFKYLKYKNKYLATKN